MRDRLGGRVVGHLRLRLHRLGLEAGQGAARLGRVGDVGVGILRRRHMRQRPERQPVAHGAVARNEKDMAAAQRPFLRAPAPPRRLRLPGLDRQDIARGLGQAAAEHAGDAVAFLGVLELRILGGNVLGQAAFLEDPFGRILIGRRDMIGRDPERRGDAPQQPLGLGGAGPGRGLLGGDQPLVAPDRHAVATPVERESPARQGLARIPLALAVVQKATGGEAVAQPADQLVRECALLRPDGFGVPFLAFEVVDRDEGRLAAHRQPHVSGRERRIDPVAERIERRPGLVGEGLGDARMLGCARNPHVEGEIDIGRGGQAADRCRIAVVWGRGKRDVALAGQEPARRV